MAIWDRFIRSAAPPASQRIEPQASMQGNGGGVLITDAHQLEEYLREGDATASGATVTPASAMRVAAVYACVRIRTGVPATLPIHVKEKVDAKTRLDRSDHPVAVALRRRPNRWQTPSQFKRMMQAHVMLRGNAYALKVTGIGLRKGELLELIPLHPDRVECRQRDDLLLEYIYTHPNGRREVFAQSEIFHLVGLTLDGVHGVSPITYARETIGLSLAMEKAGATVFKNGARPSVALKHPGKLGPEGRANIRSSIDEYRAGGENEGRALILEEGMEIADLAMSAQDAQWIEARKFSRSDIAMFFGVPPHMIGDTEKSTSWGTGIEQQTQGFLTFTAEDDLTMWEEAIDRDLIADPRSTLYVRFNRAALVKGDLKSRTSSYVSALQWGWMNPDEIRALEDMNPREDGLGGSYYDPPNTAGGGSPAPEHDEKDKTE